MIRKFFYLLTLAVLLYNISGVIAYSQNFPEKPVPPRLVNDFAGMLNNEEINSLEQKLVAFNDSTSTQIAIVIVPTLMGYDKADYAQRLGEKWGIGKKSLNNGVLILVKPKQPDSNGQVFIAQGYGLEGVFPDLTCAQIVDNDILPAFRNGDYYGGLNNAINSIMSLTRGEFSAEEYGQKGKKNAGQHMPFGLILFIIFIIIIADIQRIRRIEQKEYKYRRIAILDASRDDELRKRFSWRQLGRIFRWRRRRRRLRRIWRWQLRRRWRRRQLVENDGSSA